MQGFRGWLARVFTLDGGLLPAGDAPLDARHVLGHTRLEVATALSSSVQQRDARLGFVEHSARVALLVDFVAGELGIRGDARTDLRVAAQLHEIGMIAVPTELLEAPVPLGSRDLARVRAHAAIGAEIVRATRPARTAWLIEHQYADFAGLRRLLPAGSDDLLLASVLRAADVFDALGHPRPYQSHLDTDDRGRILQRGAGTTFHPAVVEVLLDAEQAHRAGC